MKGSRSKARGLAFQALYEIDAVGHGKDRVTERLLETAELSTENNQFVTELIKGVLDNKDAIDGYIKRFAPAYPVSQLSLVDRNILRLAIYEVLIDNKTPIKVAIDEAVELAKNFGSDHSPKFINGVLGSISSLAEKNKSL